MMSPFASIVAWLFAVAIGLVILGHGLCRAAAMKYPVPTKNAAPAPVLDPQVSARAAQEKRAGAILLCSTNGHVTPDWAQIDGRPVCTRCNRLLPKDGDLPFDREAAELVAETQSFLRRSA